MTYRSSKKKNKNYGRCSDCGIDVPRRESKRCRKCYQKSTITDPFKRLMRHVKKTRKCWLWTGYRNPQGYGAFLFKGKSKPAHRIMYQLTRSAIPKGLCVCHSCDNPPCVKPSHLWLGTHYENKMDSVRKGRSFLPTPPEWDKSGDKNPNAKITWEIVKLVRKDFSSNPNQNISALGRTYDMNPSMVHNIIKNKQWKILTKPSSPR